MSVHLKDYRYFSDGTLEDVAVVIEVVVDFECKHGSEIGDKLFHQPV